MKRVTCAMCLLSAAIIYQFCNIPSRDRKKYIFQKSFENLQKSSESPLKNPQKNPRKIPEKTQKIPRNHQITSQTSLKLIKGMNMGYSDIRSSAFLRDQGAASFKNTMFYNQFFWTKYIKTGQSATLKAKLQGQPQTAADDKDLSLLFRSQMPSFDKELA